MAFTFMEERGGAKYIFHEVGNDLILLQEGNGNVGIGTTSSPGAKLEIVDGTYTDFMATAYSTTPAEVARIRLRKSNGDVIGATAIQTDSGDALGEILFNGVRGTTFDDGARITVTQQGAIADNKIPTEMTIWTTGRGNGSDSNAVRERLQINSAGNVGIGTTTPYDAGSGYTVLHINNAASGGMIILGDGTNTRRTSLSSVDSETYLVAVGGMHFRTGSTPPSGTDRIAIDSSGMVTMSENLTLTDGEINATNSGSVDNTINAFSGASGRHAWFTSHNNANTVVLKAGASRTTNEGNIPSNMVIIHATGSANPDMYFMTNNTAQQAMIIKGSNQDIGMGISPAFPLHVFKASASRTAMADVLALNTLGTGGTGYSGIGTGIISYGRTYQESSNHTLARISFSATDTSTDDYGYSIGFDTKTLSSGTAAPTRKMTIKYDGKVGIGISTPSGVLDLGSASAGRALSWGGTTNNYTNIFSAYSNSGLVLAAGFKGSTSADTYESSYATSSTRRVGIRLDPFNNNGITFLTATAAAVAIGSAVTLTERMRIDINGYLDFNQGDANFRVTLRNNYASLFYGGLVVNASEGSTSEHALRVASNNNSSMLRVDASTDRVGIGVYAPQATLDINGSLRITTGSPADGKIWTATNSSGDGNWEDSGLLAGSIVSGTANRLAYYTDTVIVSASGHLYVNESDNSFGIGISDPEEYDSSARNLVIGNTSGDAGLTIRTSSTTDGSIYFADGDGGTTAKKGRIVYEHRSSNEDFMNFFVAGNEAFSIDWNRNVWIMSSWQPTWGTSWHTIGLYANQSYIATSQLGVNNFVFVSNAYHNGTDWKYQTTNTASIYQQINGGHVFYSAVSGTWGTTVSSVQALTINSTGDIGIGEPSPGNKLHIKGSGHDKIIIESTGTANAVGIQIEHASGNAAEQIWQLQTNTSSTGDLVLRDATTPRDTQIWYDSGNSTLIGTLTQNSDSRIKNNVQTLSSALNKVAQMRGVSFDRLDGVDSSVGLIAQELEAIAPELVQTARHTMTLTDGTEVVNPKSISYSNLVAYLIEAIKELKIEIDILKAG